MVARATWSVTFRFRFLRVFSCLWGLPSPTVAVLLPLPPLLSFSPFDSTAPPPPLSSFSGDISFHFTHSLQSCKNIFCHGMARSAIFTMVAAVICSGRRHQICNPTTHSTTSTYSRKSARGGTRVPAWFYSVFLYVSGTLLTRYLSKTTIWQ